MHLAVLIDPLLPWPAILVLAAAAAALMAHKAFSRHPGVLLRSVVLLVLMGALVNPSLNREIREYHDDIVVVVEDRSTSQEIGGRIGELETAVSEVGAGIERHGGVDIETVEFRNAAGSGRDGTTVFTALAEVLAGLDRSRVAGVILVSDGQIHDRLHQADASFPIHALITGKRGGFDRKIVFNQAPAFAVVGESVQLSAAVEDEGKFPPGAPEPTVMISVDGGAPRAFRSQDIAEMYLGPIGRGRNLVVMSTPGVAGEATAHNNVTSVVINGVRDRLRVLLVSGFPHAGQRTWRNILKSDDSIELIHFTILRSPGDQDAADTGELSLIPFPVNELFLEKIQTFDLIIFDRYVLKGFLPPVYFHYVNNYVANGGAILVSAGPEFAGPESIHATALADILPGSPTGSVFEAGYKPVLTPTGFRHPVTSGLPGAGDPDGETGVEPRWGRWFRQIDIAATRGNSLMEGVEGGGPLLMLDRIGEGRIALLASDQAWLWHRGVEGGGPQLELLRRLVHWLMKEPELEEEALRVEVEDARLKIEWRSLDDQVPDLEVTGPDGRTVEIEGSLQAPGRYAARSELVEPGLYQVGDDARMTVAAAGPQFPKEFSSTVATEDVLKEAVTGSAGGLYWIEDGVPEVRRVAEGRAAFGEDWIGLVRRNAYRTVSVETFPLLPGILVMMLAVLAAAAAWHREGRSIRA